MEKMRKQPTVEREKNVRFELVIRVKILYIFSVFGQGIHMFIYYATFEKKILYEVTNVKT